MSDAEPLLTVLRSYQDNRQRDALSRQKSATLVAVDQLWRLTGQITTELRRTGYPETQSFGMKYQPLPVNEEPCAPSRTWVLRSNDKNVTASGVDYIGDFGSLYSYWTDPADKDGEPKLVFFVDEIHALHDYDMVAEAAARVEQVRVGLEYLLSSLKDWPDASDRPD